MLFQAELAEVENRPRDIEHDRHDGRVPIAKDVVPKAEQATTEVVGVELETCYLVRAPGAAVAPSDEL